MQTLENYVKNLPFLKEKKLDYLAYDHALAKYNDVIITDTLQLRCGEVNKKFNGYEIQTEYNSLYLYLYIDEEFSHNELKLKYRLHTKALRKRIAYIHTEIAKENSLFPGTGLRLSNLKITKEIRFNKMPKFSMSNDKELAKKLLQDVKNNTIHYIKDNSSIKINYSNLDPKIEKLLMFK